MEENRENKRVDMINKRHSMDNHLTMTIYDGMILPTNMRQEKQKNSVEGPLIFTIVDEQAPHRNYQEVK